MTKFDFNRNGLPISWSVEKNEHLQKCRMISFEEILYALQNKKLLKVIPSPTHENQNCLIVDIHNYAYVVPYADDGEKIFLKTIYPSRKFTKYFLRD